MFNIVVPALSRLGYQVVKKPRGIVYREAPGEKLIKVPLTQRGQVWSASGLELGLGKTDRALTLLPLAALLHELNALEALEDRTLTANGTGCFECGVLGHILCVV